MYPLLWDSDIGGIRLCDQAGPESVHGEIRPVFHEELDLLGFDQHWSYPRSAAPLLWGVGRRYYHRGDLVAEAKGGGFFERPSVDFYRNGLDLIPVDLTEMAARNSSLLEGLAFRAVEFLHDQFQRRRRRADAFAVAFSGGKDSLAVLDLAQRAIAPDEFMVVFADTTMELKATYEAYERARDFYPSIDFHVARSHLNAVDSWQLFGPPSRIHRWCCSVHKTAPTILKLRELRDTPALDAVILDGCRREESQRRFGYTAVSAGCKHPTQVNISPILEWSSAETWLYLLSRGLPFNNGYRFGYARIGCSVCPFNSSWSEAIGWLANHSEAHPLVASLMEYAATELGDGEAREEYVRSGRWKMRSGGRALAGGGNRVIEADTGSAVTYRIRRNSDTALIWLGVLGDIQLESPSSGTIMARGTSLPFNVVRHDGAVELKVSGLDNSDRYLRRDLKSIANKVAYCVGCRACEVECPTGALSVDGIVSVEKRRCIECGNCLSFVDKGCWVAKCLSVSAEGAGMKGVNAYQTFGMSKAWLAEFLSDPDGWWRSNPRGPRQFEAMRVWLRHAELVDPKSNILTSVGRSVVRYGADSLLSWAVIWANLARNSALVRWYVSEVPTGLRWGKSELVDMMGSDLPSRTRENAVTSLMRLLSESPLGNDLGLGRADAEPAAASAKRFTRAATDDLPALAVLYAMYRYAEKVGRHDLSASELSDSRQPESPAALFGISQESLKRTLRGLANQHESWIRVELVRDLDNVYLERDGTSAEVLQVV